MSFVRERFNPVPMAADSTYTIAGQHMGGFLAKTAGTITVTSKDANGINNVTLVDAYPVAAGAYVPIPIIFPSYGATVTLAGGASGTLLA